MFSRNAKVRRRPIGDRGSVMMEFIIVLPIYLCLFGGLFLTGELLLARENLWGNDRMLAWLCGFDAGDDLADSAMARFNILKDDGESGWEFNEDDPERGKLKWAGMLDPGTQSYMISNHYLAMYSSHMSLSMKKLPAWIRGPLSVVSIFSSGSAEPWESFTINFDQMNYALHDNARHYLFKRNLQSDANGDFDRSADPQKLMNGIVWNVAGDSWPSDASASQTVSNQIPYNTTAYSRALTEFGE